MNRYDIPDRPIPSWVDNYDDKPHICPECGCEINETIYIKDGMVIGCENCVKLFDASDADAEYLMKNQTDIKEELWRTTFEN